MGDQPALVQRAAPVPGRGPERWLRGPRTRSGAEGGGRSSGSSRGRRGEPLSRSHGERRVPGETLHSGPFITRRPGLAAGAPREPGGAGSPGLRLPRARPAGPALALAPGTRRPERSQVATGSPLPALRVPAAHCESLYRARPAAQDQSPEPGTGQLGSTPALEDTRPRTLRLTSQDVFGTHRTG